MLNSLKREKKKNNSGVGACCFSHWQQGPTTQRKFSCKFEEEKKKKRKKKVDKVFQNPWLLFPVKESNEKIDRNKTINMITVAMWK